MSYKYFSNTGIQYFGDPKLKIKFETQDQTYNFPGFGDANLDFARRLFFQEWLPLSLDGERSLLRVLIGIGSEDGLLFNVFALDTTIRDIGNHTTSLVKNDIAQTLNIKTDYFEHTELLDLANSVPILYQTEQWVRYIFEKRQKKLIAIDSKFGDFDPIAAYKLLIGAFILKGREGSNNRFLPEIEILTDQAAAAGLIDTSLIIDLGNSRTIGLIVEKDINSQKFHLDNAAPLRLIDYNKLKKDGLSYLSNYENRQNSDEYDYLIGSMMRFKKNIFDEYPSDDNSFLLPSMVAIGTEAESMDGSILDDSSIGISGPKRYLWAKEREIIYWKFNNGKNIEGEALKYITMDDSDDILKNQGVAALTRKPLQPLYPKRSMMVFAMIEIIYQAYCQINSTYYRTRVGNTQIKRQLKNIVLSFPTAMPYWERDRYKKQAKKALLILNELGSINEKDIEIELGSDEASCSQLAFLFGEAQKFPGQSDSFIKLVSSSRGAEKIRLASLDIGGGTTDLMIADYSSANPTVPQDPNIKQQIIYSDGVNKAGDDILKHLIYKLVIPNIRKGLSQHEAKEDNFEMYFGPGAPAASKQVRVEALNKFFIPIAEFYMYLMENKSEITKEEFSNVNNLSNLNLQLDKRGLKKISQDCVYLENNKIFQRKDFEINIPNLIPEAQEIERNVLNIYNEVLAMYAVAINRYKPNFLILAGRTTALPIISETLRQWITISPNRIISLKDYYIGDWYPFSKQGVIKDPKTSVVIGNAIAHLSNKKLMNNMNIVTDGENSDYTLNFIGAVPKAKRIMKENDFIYQNSENGESSGSLDMVDDVSIIYRNLDSNRMPCNLMYVLSIKPDDQGRKYLPADGIIKVSLNIDNPKENLTIANVEGDIHIPTEGGTRKAAEVDDLALTEQTLFDEEYYLDNGKFDGFPPLNIGELSN